MRCPYCAEDVKDDAVVCKHCHRELFVVMPLLDKISELNARMAVSEGAEAKANAALAIHPHRATSHHYHPGLSALESVALTYIGLVLAHFLIIVHFDSKLLYLRLVSIAIPACFGFACRESERTNLFAELLWGIVVAIAAIISMTAVVSEVDKVPFIPKDAYEWRDLAYYSISIGFGFLTGVILRHMFIAIYAPTGKTNVVIDWIARFIVVQFTDGKPKFTLKAIRSMVSSVLGFGSAIISIVTGLWEVLK